MNPLSRFAPLLLLCPLLTGCPAEKKVDEQRERMAGEVSQCQGEQSALKAQVAALKAEIDQLKVAAGAQAASGGPTPDEINKLVRSSGGTLLGCWEKLLQRKSNLEGSVTAHFSIGKDGHPEGAAITPRVDEELERCMVKAIGNWKFSESSGKPIAVDVPVNLRSK